MKKATYLLILSFFTAILSGGCQKDEIMDPEVKVQIDYLGNGGYYNDDIDGVPSGLAVGTVNGPYDAKSGQAYTIEYKADNRFGVVTLQHSFNGITGRRAIWIIHCYVSGNTANIDVYAE